MVAFFSVHYRHLALYGVDIVFTFSMVFIFIKAAKTISGIFFSVSGILPTFRIVWCYSTIMFTFYLLIGALPAYHIFLVYYSLSVLLSFSCCSQLFQIAWSWWMHLSVYRGALINRSISDHIYSGVTRVEVGTELGPESLSVPSVRLLSSWLIIVYFDNALSCF